MGYSLSGMMHISLGLWQGDDLITQNPSNPVPDATEPAPSEITCGSGFVHTTLPGVAGPAIASGWNGLMHSCMVMVKKVLGACMLFFIYFIENAI
jgi:hypothetical protein